MLYAQVGRGGVKLSEALSWCALPDEGLVGADELLRRYVRVVFEAHKRNKTRTARALGVHRRTLYRWLDLEYRKEKA